MCEDIVGLNPQAMKNRVFVKYPIEKVRHKLQHLKQNIEDIATIQGSQNPELQKIMEDINPLLIATGQELADQSSDVMEVEEVHVNALDQTSCTALTEGFDMELSGDDGRQDHV